MMIKALMGRLRSLVKKPIIVRYCEDPWQARCYAKGGKYYMVELPYLDTLFPVSAYITLHEYAHLSYGAKRNTATADYGRIFWMEEILCEAEASVLAIRWLRPHHQREAIKCLGGALASFIEGYASYCPENSTVICSLSQDDRAWAIRECQLLLEHMIKEKYDTA
jgi:hypothetical protein